MLNKQGHISLINEKSVFLQLNSDDNYCFFFFSV